jgi:hypothetical protein
MNAESNLENYDTTPAGAPATPRSKRAAKRRPLRNDDANIDIIDAVIGIAIFAATIGLIGSQITSAGANLTAFPGASTLLYLVPLILVAVLILRLWKGKGRSSGRRY